MNKPITYDDLDQRASFRFAIEDDADALLPLYQDFLQETDYRAFLEIDPPLARRSLQRLIARDLRPMIVAVVDGEIVGFVSYIVDHVFSVRPCMTMIELYVAPQFRRGALGRALVGMMLLEAKALDACMVHVSVVSGLPDTNASLFNLFRKAGFEPTGYVMRKAL